MTWAHSIAYLVQNVTPNISDFTGFIAAVIVLLLMRAGKKLAK